MRFTTSSFLALAAAVAPLTVSAAPLRRGTDPNTLLVLQFAHVLEQLETQFYQQALSKFQASDFTNAGFSSANIPIEQFTAIQSDEAAHVSALESIITSFGEKPLSTCKFDFSKVLTDVSTMAPVARLVENVGVGAYLGAAHLIQDPVVLTAAASIATIEARHQTILNVLQSGTAIPQAFDIPLLPQEVLAIAGPFISGCDLGVPANAALSVTNTGSIGVGTSLTFSSPAINGSTTNFHCQMLAGGLPASISLPIDKCVVPSGINGPVAIWVTSDDQPLNNNARDRGSNAIVAGPLMTFIDVKTDAIASLVHGNNSDTPEASSILSALSSSGTSTPDGGNNNSAPTSTPAPPASSSGNGVVVKGLSMVPFPLSTPRA
ncbi:ferritin-like domain-containing protein [Multifurca ochricompacta]|uniref:Ferritin-like domain-containing protein n=1 Tax=Multifurca ochricompacta TaxID=376703 RepID=A0AAD4QN13_9AGAM|nr:ferritin-like domain-containing protein [Multifurca ochricompacta]